MKPEVKLGISTKSFQLLLNALSEFNAIETTCIYGSRAIGNYKKGSDIDLVLFGKNITPKMLLDLKVKLEQELPIPYFFDLTHYESISNQELKKHIDTYGIVIYSKIDK